MTALSFRAKLMRIITLAMLALARGFAKVLGINLIVHAQQFHHFKELHLTFYIGDDRIWDDDKYADYSKHNLNSARQVLHRFSQQLGTVTGKSVDRSLDPCSPFCVYCSSNA
jgi:hypothetical protein